jgi:beta-lactamase class D
MMNIKNRYYPLMNTLTGTEATIHIGINNTGWWVAFHEQNTHIVLFLPEDFERKRTV